MANVNCQHPVGVVWTAQQTGEHFWECFSKEEQQLNLLLWIEAAGKWWDHQEAKAHGLTEVSVHGYHKDGECPPAHPHDAGVDCIPLAPADMCVVVVLPEGNSLTLASRQPVDPEILSEVTPWERNIMLALLRYATGELERLAYSSPVALSSPYPQPYVPGF